VISTERRLRLVAALPASEGLRGAWVASRASPAAALEQLAAAWARAASTAPAEVLAEIAALAVCLIDAMYRDFRPFGEWAGRLRETGGSVDEHSPPERQVVVAAGLAVAEMHGAAPPGTQPPSVDAWVVQLARCTDADAALAAASAMLAALGTAGRPADAARIEVEAAGFEARGSPWWRGHWQSMCGQHALFAHRPDRADERFVAAAGTADAHGIRELGVVVAVMRARLALVRRDTASARALLERCGVPDEAVEPMWCAIVLQQRSLALLVDGRFVEALEAARRAEAFAARAAAPDDESVQMRVLEGYCLAVAGDYAGAGACLSAACDRAAPVQKQQARLLADIAEVLGMPAGSARREKLAHAIAFIRSIEYTGFYWPAPQVAARLCADALAAGIDVDYVRDIVRVRGLEPPPRAPRAWPWRCTIRALGDCVVDVDAAGAPDRRGVQGKPLELLQHIVAGGGRQVGVDPIVGALWPGEGRVGALTALNVTLHRLRRALGGGTAVTLSDRVLSLDPARVWLDVWALDDALRDLAKVDAGGVTEAAGAVLDLYAGPLLPAAADRAIVEARGKLRRRIDLALAAAAAQLPADECRRLLMRALAVDPDLAHCAGALLR
jgi:hypothetical protein